MLLLFFEAFFSFVKTVTLYKKLYFFFIKSLKSKKEKLVLTSFYYVNGEVWLGNLKKLI